MDPIRRYTEYMKPYLAKCERRDVADHGEAAGEELYCSSGTGTVRKDSEITFTVAHVKKVEQTLHIFLLLQRKQTPQWM